jgi:hypothetical protein
MEGRTKEGEYESSWDGMEKNVETRIRLRPFQFQFISKMAEREVRRNLGKQGDQKVTTVRVLLMRRTCYFNFKLAAGEFENDPETACTLHAFVRYYAHGVGKPLAPE